MRFLACSSRPCNWRIVAIWKSTQAYKARRYVTETASLVLVGRFLWLTALWPSVRVCMSEGISTIAPLFFCTHRYSHGEYLEKLKLSWRIHARTDCEMSLPHACLFCVLMGMNIYKLKRIASVYHGTTQRVYHLDKCAAFILKRGTANRYHAFLTFFGIEYKIWHVSGVREAHKGCQSSTSIFTLTSAFFNFERMHFNIFTICSFAVRILFQHRSWKKRCSSPVYVHVHVCVYVWVMCVVHLFLRV